MEIEVKLFGQLAEIANQSVLHIHGAADTEELIQKIMQSYPAMSAIKYRLAINKKIVTENKSLPIGTMVALLPPFSGG